jgi:hypothetical protein
MASREQALTLKKRAEQALNTAKLLFPSSTATAPADNSVQALLQRLSVSADTRDGEQAGNGQGDAEVEDESLGKAELLKRAAQRGLELLESMQEWLVLEERKYEVGMQSTDCTSLP